MEFLIVGCSLASILGKLAKAGIDNALENTDRDSDSELKRKGLERDEDIIC